MRLIAIPLSHYCERARWALEWGGLSFTEERHLPMFHLRPVRRAGGRHSTPVLVTRDGQCLTDSADIVRFADAEGARPLYPKDPSIRENIEELEAEIAARFGVETRRRAYYDLTPLKSLMLRYGNQGVPAHQRFALRLGYRFAIARMCKALKVDAEHIERGRATIDAMFAKIGEILADGRRYLFGDAFTAADLTFAAMAAPILGPPEYGVALPGLSELPSSVREEVENYRSLPAGKFVLRLYRNDRRS